MSKFWLPTQKGIDLYPSPTKIPTAVRVLVGGKDVPSSMADSMISQYAGALSRFHFAQAQNYSLSNIALQRNSAEIFPGVFATYSNQQGVEYLTLNINPIVASAAQEEKQAARKQKREPMVVEVVLTYNWFDGRDLDTVTSIILPTTDGPVGWSPNVDSTNYMQWSGDDTAGPGSETVVVNVSELLKNYIDAPRLSMSLAANWYGAQGSVITINVLVKTKDGNTYEKSYQMLVSLYAQGGPGEFLGILNIDLFTAGISLV